MDFVRALEIMKSAHAGQLDKAGKEYWTHPARVASRLGEAPEDVRIAALLHDVVEDTPISFDDLKVLGFSFYTRTLVKILTRLRDEPYMQYIARVAMSRSEWAIRIKLADLEDNMSRPLPAEMSGLLVRYAKAKEVLDLVLGRMLRERGEDSLTPSY